MRSEGFPHKREGGACRSPVLSAGEKEGGRCRSTAWHYIHSALQMLHEEMEVLFREELIDHFHPFIFSCVAFELKIGKLLFQMSNNILGIRIPVSRYKIPSFTDNSIITN